MHGLANSSLLQGRHRLQRLGYGGYSFANEQPAKAKKPRKVAADQEMLLAISGKRTTKQVVKRANKGNSGTKPKMGITN
jgi:hypothetical protein